MFKLINIFNTALGREQFYLSKNIVFTGSLQSDADGIIAGTINGDVNINGRLFIKKEAVVNGDVSASHIIVSGKIMGDIICQGKLVVKSTANIKGSVHTLEIQIEKDAVIDGIITKTSEYFNDTTDTEMNVTQIFTENSFAKKIKAEPLPETWF